MCLQDHIYTLTLEFKFSISGKPNIARKCSNSSSVYLGIVISFLLDKVLSNEKKVKEFLLKK